MKKKYVTTLLWLLTIPFTFAQISNGFESVTGVNLESASTCYFFDTNNTTAHDLVDYNSGCGLVTVGMADTPSLLGFTINFDPNTPNGTVGFTDGDAFGVGNAASVTAALGSAPPEGTQAFQIEDTDGDILMRFGKVTLAGTSTPQVSLQYFIGSSGYETNDYLYVYVEVTNCASATTVTLIDTRGQDIDDLTIEGTWNTLSADLTAYVGCTAQLFIGWSSNSSSEELGIDNVNFTEGETESTLSISESSLDTAVSLYPNPTFGSFTIKNSGIALQTVQVLDVNGKVISNIELNGITEDKTINLDLPSGMYFVRIKSNYASTVKKLIVR